MGMSLVHSRPMDGASTIILRTINHSPVDVRISMEYGVWGTFGGLDKVQDQ